MSSAANHHTLIDAATLMALQGQCQAQGQVLSLIDASCDLLDPQLGERAYAAGHLPGARYVHLDRDLSSAKTGRNGRHPLPSREAFAATVAALGIMPSTQVVIYDGQGGMYAARLWWMLRWIGHAAVAVLDGGLAAWQAAGGALSTEPVARQSGAAPYPVQASWVRSVSADELQQLLGQVRLLDARAPERFRGEVEPMDAQAGHIPGARNRFFKDNLQADGRFKAAADLRAEFIELLGTATPAQVVHQCGSGVTACHNLLAMEHVGLSGAALYPGSWSEWSADPSRPVAQGG